MEHVKQFDFLKNKFEAGQLGHAYIFSGADVSGFAKEFVKFINKHNASADNSIEKETFPDLFIVKSENSKSSLKDDVDKQEIDISLIREAQNFLSYKSYYGGYKTVIIENAERMNTDAADCFLKNLEEPKGDTLIILLSGKPEMLLPTIFSRCQQIKFAGVHQQYQLPAGLQNILGMDLAEKFKYAKTANLDGKNFQSIIHGLQSHFRNVLLAKLGIGQVAQNTYSINKLKKIINLLENISYNSLVYNSSPKLALEIILLEI